LTTAHRELQRLEGSGLLVGRAVGRSRLLRANTAHRAFEPLARLLLVTFGPHVVIAEEFASLPGVTHVVIYGSWAARYAGIDGPPPADVDVLLVGNPQPAPRSTPPPSAPSLASGCPSTRPCERPAAGSAATTH
jgi:hypothetical protein